MSANFSDADTYPHAHPRVTVVGCGGAGNNTINSIHRSITGVARTVALNTDAAHLLSIRADKKLLIGRGTTGGRGAGGNVQLGRRAAEEAKDSIRREIEGSDMVFILAGMGGGTGTGSSIVVASAAREAGVLPVSIVSMPFAFEKGRTERARDYLRELVFLSESTVMLENDRLAAAFPDQSMHSAFTVMDTLISDLVSNVTNALVRPSLLNINYSDLRSVMRSGKTSTMIFSENEDVYSLVRDAVRLPMLQQSISDAKGAIIHVSGGKSLTLEKVHRILEQAHNSLGRYANIILGAREDERESPLLSMTAIVTGVGSEAF